MCLMPLKDHTMGVAQSIIIIDHVRGNNFEVVIYLEAGVGTGGDEKQ